MIAEAMMIMTITIEEDLDEIADERCEFAAASAALGVS